MRSTAVRLLVFAMVVFAGSAAAQETTPAPASEASASRDTSIAGETEIGGRVTSIAGDPARFQRYRDERAGPTLDRLRFERNKPAWTFRASLDHAGYRDQRYTAGFDQYGKLKATFQWDQVPFFYSTDTRTAYSSPSPGVFRLNDAFQAAIQAGAPTSILGTDLRRFDLRSQRNTAAARVDYRATPALDLRASFTSTMRTGAQPLGASFGQSNAIELAGPVDRRNNDLNATAEWSTDRAMGRVAYDGSWFNNHVERVIWDNPLRVSDAAALPSQGQMSQWPDSTAHTVSAAGSLTLPARTRAFSYVSVGSWLQNDALLPFTINTAIAALPLSRPTAEAEARIVAMNYRLTSRPAAKLWLNGQFRSYDYDNRTPRFVETQYVGLDSSIVTSATGGSEPFGYVRHFVDLDASYAPLTFAAVRLGYGREHDDRTFRHFEATTEHTLRASLDSTGSHGDRCGCSTSTASGRDRGSTKRCSATSANRSPCGSSTSRTAGAIGCSRSCRWFRSPRSASAGRRGSGRSIGPMRPSACRTTTSGRSASASMRAGRTRSCWAPSIRSSTTARCSTRGRRTPVRSSTIRRATGRRT